MSGWLARIACTRAEADSAAMLDDPFPGAEPQPTLVATESDAGWELQLYTLAAPDPALLARLAELAPSASAPPLVAPLPEADWLALSQAGLQPVDAGRFHLHTGDHAGRHRPGQWPLRIDAGLAFGTGQHATTQGCLVALQRLAKRQRPAAVLDVGTGTGVLILAANHLFAKARLVASDIDARAIRVARANARRNGAPPGRILFVTAFGIAHRRIARFAPYPLVLANILAAPLVAMAPVLSLMVARGGQLLLAGLLASQQQRVRAVYQARGFRLVRASGDSEWPVLQLQRRRPAAPRTALRRARRGTAAEARRADSV